MPQLQFEKIYKSADLSLDNWKCGCLLDVQVGKTAGHQIHESSTGEPSGLERGTGEQLAHDGLKVKTLDDIMEGIS